MRKFFSVLWIFFRAEIRTEFQYRSAWWTDLVGFVLGYGTQFVLLGVLVYSFQSLNGWQPFEVMLIYSLAVSSYTIAQAFSGSFTHVTQYKIYEGEFDHTLTRPMDTMLYEIATGFSGRYFWHFIISLAMVIVAVVNIGVQFTVAKLLMFILLMLGAAMVQGGVIILFATMSFWLIGENPLNNMYMRLRSMAEYPVSIYPKAIQVFLTFVLPLGFIAFYPAQYLLDKSDYMMFGPWIQFGGPIAGVVMMGLAVLFWHYGVNHYSSSGA